MKKDKLWPDVPEMIVWNKLRHLRKKNGISQAELAVGSGVSMTLIWYLEAGFEQRVRPETRAKIAAYFKVDEDELFPLEMQGNQPRQKVLEARRT